MSASLISRSGRSRPSSGANAAAKRGVWAHRAALEFSLFPFLGEGEGDPFTLNVFSPPPPPHPAITRQTTTATLLLIIGTQADTTPHCLASLVRRHPSAVLEAQHAESLASDAHQRLFAEPPDRAVRSPQRKDSQTCRATNRSSRPRRAGRPRLLRSRALELGARPPSGARFRAVTVKPRRVRAVRVDQRARPETPG